MASVPRMTNEGTPALGEPFGFPSYGNIGPPQIATLSLSGLTIGLPVWLFSTQVILNAVSASFVSTSPQEHQPHVDPSIFTNKILFAFFTCKVLFHFIFFTK